MGGSKREHNKESRREAILKVAEGIFFAKGFEGTLMDEIAREAGCTKRTLYAYFEGKEMLFNALVRRGYKALNDMTEELMDETNPENGLVRVLRYGDIYIDFIQNYPQYFKAMAEYETHHRNNPALELFKATYDAGEISITRLIFCIRLGMDDGSIRRDIEPMGIALALYAQILGMGVLWINKRSYIEEMCGKSWVDLIDDMRRLVRGALKIGREGMNGNETCCGMES